MVYSKGRLMIAALVFVLYCLLACLPADLCCQLNALLLA